MKKFLPIIIAIGLSGCAQQAFTVHSKSNHQSPNVITHHFFIEGLGQDKTVDAAAVCNGQENVIKVESQLTFANGLLSVITFGIYTPREARVYCAV